MDVSVQVVGNDGDLRAKCYRLSRPGVGYFFQCLAGMVI